LSRVCQSILIVGLAVLPRAGVAQLSAYAIYSQQETNSNAPACGLEHTCAEAASPNANAAGGSTAGIGGGIFVE